MGEMIPCVNINWLYLGSGSIGSDIILDSKCSLDTHSDRVSDGSNACSTHKGLVFFVNKNNTSPSKYGVASSFVKKSPIDRRLCENPGVCKTFRKLILIDFPSKNYPSVTVPTPCIWKVPPAVAVVPCFPLNDV